MTMDLDCSHKIKRHLLLVRKKDYEKPAECIKIGRDSLFSEVCSVKTMVFPVIRYRCAIWTIRNGERQIIELLNCGA